MIFYFSGTGNSLDIAKSIGENQGEKLISISKAMNDRKDYYEYTLEENETIGFIYPVYAWAPPSMVIEFIKKLRLKNYKDNYIFSVATCGENIGNTMKVLDKALNKNGLKLSSGFSIKMPNNYIVLGNVDSKEVEEHKLLAAKEKVKIINEIIRNKENQVFQIDKGFMGGMLTIIVNPMFNKRGISVKEFYANDNCNSCRICEKVCNSQIIKVTEKPRWEGQCTQCLACIHLCPQKAIQYGKGTEAKGRYKNPNVKIKDMEII